MPNFQYTGKDAQGKSTTGTIAAENVTQARNLLLTKKIFIQTIDEQVKKGGGGSFFEWVSFSDLLAFYTSLSIAISAGASLREALSAYAEQCPNMKLKRCIEGVLRNIESGKSFSESLKQHGDIFTNDFTSLVDAGEKAGNMSEMLRDYTIYAEKSAKIRSKAMGALIYPAVMILVASIVVISLATVIFPKFIQAFNLTPEQMPVLTRYVWNFSEFLINNWVLLLIGVPAGCFMLMYLSKTTQTGKQIVNWLQFNIPVLAGLSKKFYVSRFVRVLGAQLKGGVPGLSALLVTREATDNIYFQAIVDDIIESLKAGSTYAAPMRKYPHIIPPIVALMISIGERSGAMAEVLEKIGNYYDDQVAAATEGLVALIEPLMIVVMGVLVAIIAISMFLPIFNMTKTVG